MEFYFSCTTISFEQAQPVNLGGKWFSHVKKKKTKTSRNIGRKCLSGKRDFALERPILVSPTITSPHKYKTQG